MVQNKLPIIFNPFIMKIRSDLSPVFALCLMIYPLIGNAQVPADSTLPSARPSFSEKGLFETDKPLEITLSGNIRELLNDRTSKAPKYFSLRLDYRAGDS